MHKNIYSIYLLIFVVLLFETFLYNEQIAAKEAKITSSYASKVENTSNEFVINTFNTPSKPVMGDEVWEQVSYYEENSDSKKQENSLLYYNNTYFPNTGILYASEAPFDVISSFNSTVTNIEENSLYGTILTISNNNITAKYYGLKNINVKIGDKIYQNDIIGKSNKNIYDNYKQTILFEVYINNNLINPTLFYNYNI